MQDLCLEAAQRPMVQATGRIDCLLLQFQNLDALVAQAKSAHNAVEDLQRQLEEAAKQLEDQKALIAGLQVSYPQMGVGPI